jgi:hypothetical protein
MQQPRAGDAARDAGAAAGAPPSGTLAASGCAAVVGGCGPSARRPARPFRCGTAGTAADAPGSALFAEVGRCPGCAMAADARVLLARAQTQTLQPSLPPLSTIRMV